ncbi:unnamed protein product [Mytilus coruscus]|uniref:TRIM2_3 n=1 Tax=Mytilus coruscus TaxID=42192 RepID=A0A6J8C3U0_MYTCO|nr:unnamed protein product [Mytilus coruscus]
MEEICDQRKDQQYVPNVCGIEQIKPSLLRRLTIPTDKSLGIIWDCLVLPDGKSIINDHDEKRLHLFSNEGIYIKEIITFKEHPNNACFVSNNTVAVTLEANQIALVDVEKNEIINTTKLSHQCYGIASDDQTLVISSDDKCSRVNLIDMSQTILEGVVKLKCVSLFQGNIYGTVFYEDKVRCYTSTGEALWTFQSHDIHYSGGIALDKNGFVYIASYQNNEIQVISPDGKTCKTILSEVDGIRSSVAININRETGLMIISSDISDYNCDQTAFVYKI